MFFQLTTWNPINSPFEMLFVKSAWGVARIQIKHFSNGTLFPLPFKLRESEIWDIRGYFSLIIMYTFKIKDYNDNKNN